MVLCVIAFDVPERIRAKYLRALMFDGCRANLNESKTERGSLTSSIVCTHVMFIDLENTLFM